MAAIYIDENEVATLADTAMAIAAVDSAHRQLALGAARDTPRARTRTPTSMLHLMHGALDHEGVIGYKAYTSSRSGVRFAVHLFAISDGTPLAVIAGERLGVLRTAAAAALASRYLARSDARVLTVFGAGLQAKGHVEALIAALPSLNDVRVVARNRERLTATLATWRLPVALCPFTSTDSDSALAGADIVSTVTTSSEPLFRQSQLGKGVHINAVGANALIRREIGEDCVLASDRIVVDSRATALAECGDLFVGNEKGKTHAGQWVELGDLLIGRQQGRRNETEQTLFESQGLAIQDLALAARIYQRALDSGVGRPLPW